MTMSNKCDNVSNINCDGKNFFVFSEDVSDHSYPVIDVTAWNPKMLSSAQLRLLREESKALINLPRTAETGIHFNRNRPSWAVTCWEAGTRKYRHFFIPDLRPNTLQTVLNAAVRLRRSLAATNRELSTKSSQIATIEGFERTFWSCKGPQRRSAISLEIQSFKGHKNMIDGENQNVEPMPNELQSTRRGQSNLRRGLETDEKNELGDVCIQWGNAIAATLKTSLDFAINRRQKSRRIEQKNLKNINNNDSKKERQYAIWLMRMKTMANNRMELKQENEINSTYSDSAIVYDDKKYTVHDASIALVRATRMRRCVHHVTRCVLKKETGKIGNSGGKPHLIRETYYTPDINSNTENLIKANTQNDNIVNGGNGISWDASAIAWRVEWCVIGEWRYCYFPCEGRDAMSTAASYAEAGRFLDSLKRTTIELLEARREKKNENPYWQTLLGSGLPTCRHDKIKKNDKNFCI